MSTLTKLLEELIEENKKLQKEIKFIKHFIPYDELDFLNEIKELKKEKSKLLSENTKLQNDLFTQQLNEDETDEYIEKLKSERDYWKEEFHQFIDENDKQIEYIEKLKNELFQIYINKRY